MSESSELGAVNEAEAIISEFEQNRHRQVKLPQKTAHAIFGSLQGSEFAKLQTARMFNKPADPDPLRDDLITRLKKAIEESGENRNFLGRKNVVIDLSYREINAIGDAELARLSSIVNIMQERRNKPPIESDSGRVAALKQIMREKFEEMEHVLQSPMSIDGITLKYTIEFGKHWLVANNAFVKVGGLDNIDLRNTYQRMASRGFLHALERTSF